MIRAALLLSIVIGALPAFAGTRAWDFRVRLDGRDIGRHQFTLHETGGERELRSAALFEVSFLFFTAWRYDHEATEGWRGDCLESLASRTETNAERESVRAARRDGRLVVERGGRQESHEGCVMSFAYWNPRILAARRLLNSQTGELLPVRVTSLGEETLQVRGLPRRTQRHRLDAPPLAIDIWFAGDEWVALESIVAGGRLLRYDLR
ncbi:DUF6134 family protein [Usitatibacter palustris]|uniref:DUF3108 domain-containing protein n=1 Tax=Usitatibacter palustris TaxID=2732487 RepID=A0A6M4H2K4_9PROT|nr:DUF6134 family protein [Usitatibacter palustris]QJR13736.1 hypothetical protein DSM104440_00526 [Usitatibacter palustris]